MNKRDLLHLTLVLYLLAAAAFGQPDTGALSGAATDPSGAAVAGAAVQLKNAATGSVRSVTTFAEGRYRFDLLALGAYHLKVDSPHSTRSVTRRPASKSRRRRC